MDHDEQRDYDEERANEALLHPEDEDGLIHATVTGLKSDHGSVVLLTAITDDDDSREIVFAADHPPAQDIVSALESGEDVHVALEPWQIYGRVG